ncbi:hypothetical protein ACOMHN_023061 [Nucella lapillus]
MFQGKGQCFSADNYFSEEGTISVQRTIFQCRGQYFSAGDNVSGGTDYVVATTSLLNADRLMDGLTFKKDKAAAVSGSVSCLTFVNPLAWTGNDEVRHRADCCRMCRVVLRMKCATQSRLLQNVSCRVENEVCDTEQIAAECVVSC